MANMTKRPSNNAYKKGKLSKNARFSPKKIKWTPIIILICLLATFILAMIFGNILGKKVTDKQNSTLPEDSTSNLTPPSTDNVNPQKELHAYFVDMTGADPKKSLSEQTSSSRDRGNALFFEIKNSANEIIYSSDKVTELNFEHKENLTLSRLANHLEYYDDFAVGLFKSDYSPNLDREDALKLQTNEILLLTEASEMAFGQIIVEFSGEINKDNLIFYQTYLLNLKLSFPKTPVGIKISTAFLNNPNNAGAVAGLLNIADFFVLDLADKNSQEIKDTLAPLIYFTERYDCVIMISDAEEGALAEKILALESKGVENYIVK